MGVTATKKGPGRPKGSKNKPKAAPAPVIDDGLDDDDDGLDDDDDGDEDEVPDVDDVDEIPDVEEDDEDMNLPQEFVEDALRSAPKKGVKSEPLPEKKAKAEKAAPAEVDLGPVFEALKGLETKVPKAVSAVTSDQIAKIEGRLGELETAIEKVGQQVSRLHTYLEGALPPEPAPPKSGDAEAAAKKSEETSAKKSGLTEEQRAALTKYVATLYRKLKPGKKYGLKSVVDLVQDKFGPDVATPSRVQGLLEENGIRILDAKEGLFSVTEEDDD